MIAQRTLTDIWDVINETGRHTVQRTLLKILLTEGNFVVHNKVYFISLTDNKYFIFTRSMDVDKHYEFLKVQLHCDLSSGDLRSHI